MPYSLPALLAQGRGNTFKGAMKPLGYQQISSPAASTALTVPDNSKMAVISVETQAVRYRDDGTAPTAAIGMPLAAGVSQFEYVGDLSAIRFIQAIAGAVINVSYYG